MLKPITLTIILILLIMGTAPAYWPISLEENLPIAVREGISDWLPNALPLSGNRTLVVYHKGAVGNCIQIIDQ